MSLEPISFTSKKNIKNSLDEIGEIKKIIFNKTGIVVNIKKFEPPKIIISVNNSPAASELNHQKNILIKILNNYKIKIIVIKTI